MSELNNGPHDNIQMYYEVSQSCIMIYWDAWHSLGGHLLLFNVCCLSVGDGIWEVFTSSPICTIHHGFDFDVNFKMCD